MYILDNKNNTLIATTKSSFKDLKLKERNHLQEWIAKQPSVLGEDLLVIQKEFDGFKDTNERLDLLALDKDGNIVVIENKLDDSGKDVTWQAIKYASYCSSLSKDEIADIYAKFLKKDTQAAQENIMAFYDVDDWEEITLNEENGQRIIFVAANFRKEVTSSVMWLRGFGINASCIKVMPSTYDGKVIVDFDQVIPVKDAEDYMIKMANKKKADAIQSASTKKRHTERSIFWQKFIEYNQSVNGDYATSSGTPDGWLAKGVGTAGVGVNIVISKEKSRAEIYIHTGDTDRNKGIYDFLFENKVNIEAELGEMQWERLDGKVTCRISQTKTLSYCRDEDHEEIFKFFVERTAHYIKVFGKILKGYKK